VDVVLDRFVGFLPVGDAVAAIDDAKDKVDERYVHSICGQSAE
jgi:hypothetical protein